jgi:hypothetical protein
MEERQYHTTIQNHDKQDSSASGPHLKATFVGFETFAGYPWAAFDARGVGWIPYETSHSSEKDTHNLCALSTGRNRLI